MNFYLIGLGAWVVFDGIVSMTYFAEFVDKTTKNTADQVVRVVRTIAGICRYQPGPAGS
jgi:hypothetical protein